MSACIFCPFTSSFPLPHHPFPFPFPFLYSSPSFSLTLFFSFLASLPFPLLFSFLFLYPFLLLSYTSIFNSLFPLPFYPPCHTPLFTFPLNSAITSLFPPSLPLALIFSSPRLSAFLSCSLFPYLSLTPSLSFKPSLHIPSLFPFCNFRSHFPSLPLPVALPLPLTLPFRISFPFVPCFLHSFLSLSHFPFLSIFLPFRLHSLPLFLPAFLSSSSPSSPPLFPRGTGKGSKIKKIEKEGKMKGSWK
jgi:hypothetical protein